ncbi:hypothetical protein [Halobaculum sp. EA56]|uniref:hypothetical protein n=1 Tax=Halobaculum sp. EA56 TaxID=3421648 RepID=UPI003EBAAAF2
MAEEKIITVTVAGSGRSFEVPVSPGDQPDDVLWEVVENEDEYSLRRGDGDVIDPDTDVHEEIDEGEVTYAATQPVVGA